MITMHRVLVCDDQDLVRLSVLEILKRQTGVQVVGEASGDEAAIRAALELLPDLVRHAEQDCRRRRAVSF